MRIKLKKDYQKKLILLAKEENNLTWGALSKKIGVSEQYLRNELKKEKTTLSKEVYERLKKLTKENFDSFIEEILQDDWGRSKGGKNQRNVQLLLNEPSIILAEMVGIILGDGNLWEKEGGYYYVRICGDSIKDKDYLINYVCPLFKKLFGVSPNIIKHKTHNELFLSKGNKDIIFTLKKFGLKTGDKIKNDVGIPDWVFDSKDYLKACIRGLVDTDGSVCPITGRNYSYIWFSSNIPRLRSDFSKAMALLGIQTSKWNYKKGHAPEVYIGSKKSIERFFKEVGFSNLKHLRKFHAPVV
jgi:intein/homing endonuclease